MDPFLLSLAVAIGTGISNVAGKIIDKGVDVLVEPAVNEFKARAQKDLKAKEKENALAQAILAAIKDSSKQKDESLIVTYARRLTLHRLIEPSNEPLRDEIVRLMFLAHAPDPNLIPQSVLDALHLSAEMRLSLATFLFHLRRRLSDVPEFKPLLDEAHKQTVETALKEIKFDLSALAGIVETTEDGKKVARVRVEEEKWDPVPYLGYLANVCNDLPLRAIDPQFASLRADRKISLIDVYTNLEVTALAPLERGKKLKGRTEREQMEELIAGRSESRRLTALEIASDAKKNKTVLLGDPGSGKSTFVNYLALCLAMSQVEPNGKWKERLTVPILQMRVAVRVILRDLITWAGDRTDGNAAVLWDFIQADLKAHGFEEHYDALKKHVQTRGGLILLDGLDEVPDANARREFVKAVVEDFIDGCAQCRFIVTCRPYAYKKREWKLNGFVEEKLAEFNPKQIQQFIRGWYNAFQNIYEMSPALADSNANALIAATTLPDLAPLAQNPLLLTLMATLHSSRGKLPHDRAKLYADCVDLLLDHWQEHKKTRIGVVDTIEQGLQDALAISRGQLDKILNQVAFQAHQTQGQQKDRQTGTADIRAEQLRAALAPILNNSLDKANLMIQYVHTRAGLLIAKDEITFVFPHRTFQEFLAARSLLDSEEFPFNLAAWTRADPAWWREVYLLAAAQTNLNQAVYLINELCPDSFSEDSLVSSHDLRAPVLAAQAGAEIRLAESARQPGRYQNTLLKLQNWLLAIIQRGLLNLPDRAEAGRVLSALSDPRADVSCEIPELVTVGAGKFKMGSKKDDDAKPHEVTLKEYRIGKYPVTNAQFRGFVENQGYADLHRDCWTDEGWKWREQEKVSKPIYWDNPQWNLDNHPVVGVSWYEAVAFCNWLNTKNADRKFRLPTEAEWEIAARGDDEREFPWAGEFDSEKANTFESGIQRTTAVGLFPKGKSHCAAYDLAGNVWEWCSSLYEPYPFRENDGREKLSAEGARILRGGSWTSV